MKLSRPNSSLALSGFTLIEILVVVAIIGVLTTVVLSNTADSRVAAREAAIMEHARQLNNIAVLIYNQKRSYEEIQVAYVENCSDFATGNFTTELQRLCNAIQDNGGEIFSGATIDGGAGLEISPEYIDNIHSFIIQLPSAPNKYFCISTNGNTFLGEIGTNPDPDEGGYFDPVYDAPHPPGCPFNADGSETWP